MITPLPKTTRFASLLALIIPGAACGATMTLQFSNVGSNHATNWANGAGAAGKNMAWGIIVDRDGNGLASSYRATGVNYGTPTGTGQSLLNASGTVTDDMLIMSPIAMVTVPENFDGLDGSLAGQNVITAINSVPFLSGVDPGDVFHLVWFDTDFGSSAAAVSGAPQAGDAYGIFSHASFIVPGEGHTVSYAPAFDGPDALKPMNYNFVPEPSAMVLGLAGAALALRRRR